MKHQLLIKSFIVLLILLSGLQYVSMSQIHHPTSQAKMIAVENEIVETFTFGEEQKHFDLFKSLGTAYLLLVTAITLSLYGQRITFRRQKLKIFLLAVYYQSSYFSKVHLFKPTLHV